MFPHLKAGGPFPNIGGKPFQVPEPRRDPLRRIGRSI
jgi:hypothetical protein